MPVIYGRVVLFVIAGSWQAIAGSVLGDAMDDLCGNCGLGEALEDAQREVVQAVLTYRQFEEAISKSVETLTRQGIVESGAPLICAAIRNSRDEARRAGTQPIPKEIRDRLSVYFRSEFLNGVEYRVAKDDAISLQTIFFPLGASAITLDHVIVFRSPIPAESLWMWAHELGHVRQVERSGLDGFCKDYLRDFLAVEEEADRVADDVMARRRAVRADGVIGVWA